MQKLYVAICCAFSILMLQRLIVASTYERKSIIGAKIRNRKSKNPGCFDLEGLRQPRRQRPSRSKRPGFLLFLLRIFAPIIDFRSFSILLQKKPTSMTCKVDATQCDSTPAWGAVDLGVWWRCYTNLCHRL